MAVFSSRTTDFVFLAGVLPTFDFRRTIRLSFA